MVISKEYDGRVMPFAVTSHLLHEAGADIQRKVIQHGADTPLVENYEYVYRNLRIEAWQYISEEESKVTYAMVRNMVIALENKLWQLDDVECDVALSRLVRGIAQPAGHGLIGFVDDPLTNGINGTVTSFPNGSNGTVAGLGADQWHCRVDDTLFVIRKNPNGRRMPTLESLQLLNEATRDLELQIDQRGGGDIRIEGGNYVYHYQGLTLEAHQWPGVQLPVTYDTVQNMVSGLKDCFWRVNYVESTIEIDRIGSRTIADVGFGIISFLPALNRANITIPTAGSATQNEISSGLPPSSTSNVTLGGLEKPASSVATA